MSNKKKWYDYKPFWMFGILWFCMGAGIGIIQAMQNHDFALTNCVLCYIVGVLFLILDTQFE